MKIFRLQKGGASSYMYHDWEGTCTPGKYSNCTEPNRVYFEHRTATDSREEGAQGYLSWGRSLLAAAVSRVRVVVGGVTPT